MFKTQRILWYFSRQHGCFVNLELLNLKMILAMGKGVKKAKWLVDFHKSVYLLFCNAALSSKNSYNI